MQNQICMRKHTEQELNSHNRNAAWKSNSFYSGQQKVYDKPIFLSIQLFCQ